MEDEGVWSRDRWSSTVTSKPLLRTHVMAWRGAGGPSDHQREQIRTQARRPWSHALREQWLQVVFVAVMVANVLVTIDDVAPWMVIGAVIVAIGLGLASLYLVVRRVRAADDLLSTWDRRVERGEEAEGAASG